MTMQILSFDAEGMQGVSMCILFLMFAQYLISYSDLDLNPRKYQMQMVIKNYINFSDFCAPPKIACVQPHTPRLALFTPLASFTSYRIILNVLGNKVLLKS